MKKMFPLFVLFFLAFSLILSGCESKEAGDLGPSPDGKDPAAESSWQGTGDDQEKNGPEHPFTAPLTGTGSNIPLESRIIMVMIENHAAARPQSGLNKADIVYEVLAEGGITRFAAFFHSEYPESVGPVRSIRPYFLELGKGFDALLVHAGGSPEALRAISDEGLPSINGLVHEPKYFWRVKSRKAPHNLYTDFSKIKEVAEKLKYRKQGKIPSFRFLDAGDEVEGSEASRIEVQYFSTYRVGYQYDAEKGNYFRTINGKPHTDWITGEQLAASNILVIKTRHRTLDAEGRLAVDLKSGGEGYLFQKGKVQEVAWKNVDGVIRAFKDGEEIGLVPGKTWVNIIPEEHAGVTYE